MHFVDILLILSYQTDVVAKIYATQYPVTMTKCLCCLEHSI